MRAVDHYYYFHLLFISNLTLDLSDYPIFPVSITNILAHRCYCWQLNSWWTPWRSSFHWKLVIEIYGFRGLESRTRHLNLQENPVFDLPGFYRMPEIIPQASKTNWQVAMQLACSFLQKAEFLGRKTSSSLDIEVIRGWDERQWKDERMRVGCPMTNPMKLGESL